ncbi:ferric reductase-like transmembrane domain-containing protein [Parabacteroides sp. OttesenSCG-928-G06]|nr:ferric reductase-like transmembrane domain-containing protein [Parabacteroides sp. OttesenSCG-928-K15]MDL2281828.1 ferric reductase-like transmembrane domain-containing protein [Parabacteroides sp. OttesenSCG-928-G06]
MIKILIDLLSFLRTTVPLLFCVAVFALLFIWLAKSIKRYYYIYYTLFIIPSLMVVVPSLLRIFGVETSFSFTRIPVLGELLRDYIHMASLGHPLLIIIMYIGALDVRNPYVKRLMSIRKEMSILSGFPILTHSWIRVLNNFPEALKYFTDHSAFMENPRVTSELGAGITNTVLVLGIVMLVLFFILWITSFDAIHKRLGGIRWKKIQRWSYALYALLFIHAMGLQVGRMVNSASDTKPRTEVVTRTQAAPQAQGGHGGRAPAKGLTDIKVNNTTKQWISVSSLLLIYGSYLILRVRKARKKGKKQRVSATA